MLFQRAIIQAVANHCTIFDSIDLSWNIFYGLQVSVVNFYSKLTKTLGLRNTKQSVDNILFYGHNGIVAVELKFIATLTSTKSLWLFPA